MLVDDPAYDRQSQSGSALFSGEIGKKELLFHLIGNTVTRVCHDYLDGIT